MEKILSHFPYSEVKESIHKTALVREHEASEQRYWGRYRSPISFYETFFGNLSDHESGDVITPLLLERKRKGKSMYLLDLGGGTGQALRNLAEMKLLDGAVNIGLTDMRNKKEKRCDEKHNIHLVTGNALQGSLWRSVKEKIGMISHTGMIDVAMVLPLGGLRPPEKDNFLKARPEQREIGLEIPPAAYHHILTKMLYLLTPDRGTLLSQVPYNIPAEARDEYLRRLNDHTGLEVIYDHNLIYRSGKNDTEASWRPRSDFDKGVIKIIKTSTL